MKKLLTLIFTSIFMFTIFTACSEEEDSFNNIQDNTPKVTQEMIDRYDSLKGTWIPEEEYSGNSFKKIVLNDNRIEIDGNIYPFNKNTDLFDATDLLGGYIGFTVGTRQIAAKNMFEA